MTEPNGRVVVNGRFGRVVEWLRWALPILMIPLFLWAVQVQIFMQSGDRFTPGDMTSERNAIKLEYREFIAARFTDGDPMPKLEKLADEVKANTIAIGRLEGKVDLQIALIREILSR